MTTTPMRAMTAAMIPVAGAVAMGAGFQITTGSMLKVAAASCGMVLFAWIYTALRPRPKIARPLEAVALLLVFNASAGVLSYGAVAVNMPLQDPLFSTLDETLGFDWAGFLAFASGTPLLPSMLIAAYHSSILQIIILVAGLGFLGRVATLDRFLLAYALTAVTVIFVSMFLPAIGPYAYNAPDPSIMGMTADAGIWHLAHFEALRAGSFTTLDLGEIEGLITFPSFHTALAVLTIWAAWNVPFMRWPALLLNAFLIVGTLPEGGHYLVDLFAGAAIAALAIAVAKRVCAAPSAGLQPMHPDVSPEAATLVR